MATKSMDVGGPQTQGTQAIHEKSNFVPCPSLTQSHWFSRYTSLTMPPGSLSKICEPTLKILAARELRQGNKSATGWAGEFTAAHPLRCEAFLFAADHGVAHSERVSAFPQEITGQMVANFLSGGAAMSILAQQRRIDLHVVDAGTCNTGNSISPTTKENPPAQQTKVPKNCPSQTLFYNWKDEFRNTFSLMDQDYFHGSESIAKQDAMLLDHHLWFFSKAQQFVKEQVERNQLDIVILGEMGIGNTTPASAISSLLLKESEDKLTGIGTGVGLEQRRNKAEVVKAACSRWKMQNEVASAQFSSSSANVTNAHQLLTGLGGFEFSCMAGAAIGAAKHGAVVLLDGFICTAAIAPFAATEPNFATWLMASHESAEPGHSKLLQFLNLSPFLRLGMRLGEGTGAALTLGLLQDGFALLQSMTTMQELSAPHDTNILQSRNETGIT